MRNLLSLLLACLTAITLTGCGLKSGEDLYQLPKASAEYESLQTCLEDILDRGLEYSAPLTGSNLQSVQLTDLDNPILENLYLPADRAKPLCPCFGH